MTSPEHLDDLLSGLLDGELSDDEAAAAHAHLADCAVCTAELAALDRTRARVRALPFVDPRRPPALPADEARRPPALLAAAAAVLVLLALPWLPSDRRVAPALAGFDRTHASLVQSRPSASLGSAQPVAVRTELPGFRHVATSRKGQTVHVLYSDGDRALSVFAEPGDLAESSLPPGGRTMRITGHTLWHWHRADGDIVLWQSDGVVYTAVGDAPLAQVFEAAASMPDEDRELSVGERLRRAARSAADLLTGG